MSDIYILVLTHLCSSMSGISKSIQCLRCFSIIAVFSFHLLPEIFPNGYLGVDVFFVISGFLIFNIFKDNYLFKLNLFTLSDFYIRRFRRIFPGYLTTLILTSFFAKLFLLRIDFEFLKTDLLWAGCFGSNLQQIYERRDYFDMVRFMTIC